MTYHQITSEERYILATLRKQGLTKSEIARELGRHRSTIGRELKRNSARWDGHYRPSKAIERTAGRRSRSRRNQRFTRSDLRRVDAQLRDLWSPEQICGRLHGSLSISHETIYRHIWRDRILGGSLHTYLRGARKRRRKRYGAYDSRGRLAGKRHISERPVAAELRSEIGHWEIDTVIGKGDHHCLVTVVDRKTGYVVIGKLRARTKEHTNRRTARLMRRQRHRVPRLRAARAHDRCCVLLRYPSSLLGTRNERKHQRLNSPVRPEGHQHGQALPAPLQRHRSRSQQPTAQTTRLQNTSGVLR